MLYYPKQDITTSQAFHSPLICLRGGGWAMESLAEKMLRLASGKDIIVNRLMIAKEMEKQLVYFWYVQNGIASTDTNSAKLVQIRNSIIDGRTDGSMLRFVTPIKSGETPEDAEARLDRFLAEQLKGIYDYLGWAHAY
jgi:EpsI family protein